MLHTGCPDVRKLLGKRHVLEALPWEGEQQSCLCLCKTGSWLLGVCFAFGCLQSASVQAPYKHTLHNV